MEVLLTRLNRYLYLQGFRVLSVHILRIQRINYLLGPLPQVSIWHLWQIHVHRLRSKSGSTYRFTIINRVCHHGLFIFCSRAQTRDSSRVSNPLSIVETKDLAGGYKFSFVSKLVIIPPWVVEMKQVELVASATIDFIST